MWQQIYVQEKLRELERERDRPLDALPPTTRAPLLGPLAWAAGRALRRMGERLESLGDAHSPAPGPLPAGESELTA